MSLLQTRDNKIISTSPQKDAEAGNSNPHNLSKDHYPLRVQKHKIFYTAVGHYTLDNWHNLTYTLVDSTPTI